MIENINLRTFVINHLLFYADSFSLAFHWQLLKCTLKCNGKRHISYLYHEFQSLFPDSSLQWRHNGRGGISNHQPHDCLLNRFFSRRSKKTSKLRVTGLCARNSPVTDEFPAQRASNGENVSIWWRHHFVPYTIKLEYNNWTFNMW